MQIYDFKTFNLLISYITYFRTMKKITPVIISILFLFALSSFEFHKFYVSIYQVEHNVLKKRIQITSRIFIDDLNKVLTKHAGQKTQIGEKTQTQKDIDFFKNYMTEKVKVNINGKDRILLYKSSEILGDQLVCYFIIADISKLKTFTIENTALFEINAQQQNIVNISIKNKKQSFILVSTNPKGMLKF